MCEENEEDDVNAADARDAEPIHPFISGCHLLLLQLAYRKPGSLRKSVIINTDMHWIHLRQDVLQIQRCAYRIIYTPWAIKNVPLYFGP